MRITLAHYEDWIQLFVDGEVYFESHSIPNSIWLDVLFERGAEVGESISFDEFGPYFMYGGTPQTEEEARTLYESLAAKAADGYELNYYTGEWMYTGNE